MKWPIFFRRIALRETFQVNPRAALLEFRNCWLIGLVIRFKLRIKSVIGFHANKGLLSFFDLEEGRGEGFYGNAAESRRLLYAWREKGFHFVHC